MPQCSAHDAPLRPAAPTSPPCSERKLQGQEAVASKVYESLARKLAEPAAMSCTSVSREMKQHCSAHPALKGRYKHLFLKPKCSKVGVCWDAHQHHQVASRATNQRGLMVCTVCTGKHQILSHGEAKRASYTNLCPEDQMGCKAEPWAEKEVPWETPHTAEQV